MKMRLVVASLCAVYFSASAIAEVRDGNWWQTQSQVAKEAYVTGLADSGAIGLDLLSRACKSKEKHVVKCDLGYQVNFVREGTRYLDNQKPSLIVAEMDDYYSDHSNDKIKTSTIYWWVVSAEAGKAPTIDEIVKERRLSE